jgi:hypothetical protein
MGTAGLRSALTATTITAAMHVDRRGIGVMRKFDAPSWRVGRQGLNADHPLAP